VYAVARKLKPRLELQPVGRLEERVRYLENLIMQSWIILHQRHRTSPICPKCAEHPLKYFEDKGAVGYRCKCGYKLEF